MKQHQQVIQFACGLADDPHPLLEIVYQHVVQLEMQSKLQTEAEASQFDMFSASELSSNAQLVWSREFNNTPPSSFIQKIWTQFTGPVNIEPLNNRYINYVKPDTKKVHVPSKFYLLCDVTSHEALVYDVDSSATHKSKEELIAGCALGINSGDLEGTLKLLHQIQEHQQVEVRNVCMVDVNMKKSDDALFSALKIGRKSKFVRIVNCALLPSFYKHLIQELADCTKMCHIDLSRTQGTPIELGKVLSTMETLTYLDLTENHMSCKVSTVVLSALPHCSHLIQLNLGGNSLTNCIEKLCSEKDRITFPCLESLRLDDTGLSTEDVINLARITHGSKLKLLNISNNCISDCLKHVLSGAHYPNLEHLQMVNCQLGKTDVASLSRAADEGKVPKLKILDLTENTLTSCIGDLMGDASHMGFGCLEELLLKKTRLCAADMASIAQAASVEKMPRIDVLNLSQNDLTNCIEELFGNTECPVFLSLSQLELDGTKLKKTDVANVTKAMSYGQLPTLDYLFLRYNNMSSINNTVLELLEVCHSHCMKSRILRSSQNDDTTRQQGYTVLNLSGNSLSDTAVKTKLSEIANKSEGFKIHIEPRDWGYELYYLLDTGDIAWCFTVEF